MDPSRSELIGRAATELSGSGPRPFDADQRLNVPLYLLDVSRPFGRWSVLARTGGGDADTLRFADLGLDPTKDHVVFEFWTKTLRGAFQGGFAPGPVDPRRQVQVFCIREREDRPQVVATSRHVSCGGPDLEAVSWAGDALSGRSRLVRGDAYELHLTEPAGYRFDGVTAQARRWCGDPGGRRPPRGHACGRRRTRWPPGRCAGPGRVGVQRRAALR